jgi:hypothetical protein
MYEEHRWTFKDLVHHMVTAEAEEKYHATTTKRAKDVFTAVFDQPEVLAAINTTGGQAAQLRGLGITDVIKGALAVPSRPCTRFIRS